MCLQAVWRCEFVCVRVVYVWVTVPVCAASPDGSPQRWGCGAWSWSASRMWRLFWACVCPVGEISVGMMYAQFLYNRTWMKEKKHLCQYCNKIIHLMISVYCLIRSCWILYTDPSVALGVRGHLRNHADVVGVAVGFAGFVRGPPATRLPVHFRIGVPASAHTQPISHRCFWHHRTEDKRNTSATHLPMHGRIKITVKQIYRARALGKKLRVYGMEAHRHGGTSYFYSQLARARGRTPEVAV